jgi:hypothetical protein
MGAFVTAHLRRVSLHRSRWQPAPTAVVGHPAIQLTGRRLLLQGQQLSTACHDTAINKHGDDKQWRNGEVGETHADIIQYYFLHRLDPASSMHC